MQENRLAKLASSTPIVIEDFDAAFVFHYVNDCNTRLLELSEAIGKRDCCRSA